MSPKDIKIKDSNDSVMETEILRGQVKMYYEPTPDNYRLISRAEFENLRYLFDVVLTKPVV